MKILAVDDDTLMLEMLQAILWNAGHRDIVLASSADQALEKIAYTDEPFDCILLDIEMPKKDGIRLCSDIRRREDYKSKPILMLTAKLDEVSIKKSFEAGATDYIRKPFHIDNVIYRIGNATRSCVKENRALALERALRFNPKSHSTENDPMEDFPGIYRR